MPVLSVPNSNLHSNMVRFIMDFAKQYGYVATFIYIPIWLDLLLDGLMTAEDLTSLFTFQYG